MHSTIHLNYRSTGGKSKCGGLGDLRTFFPIQKAASVQAKTTEFRYGGLVPGNERVFDLVKTTASRS